MWLPVECHSAFKAYSHSAEWRARLAGDGEPESGLSGAEYSSGYRHALGNLDVFPVHGEIDQ